MAKSKHSIALFEVVQTAKRQNRSSAEMLRTPKWWFKTKPKSAPACPAPPLEPEPVMVETAASAPAPRAPGVDLKLDPDRQRITFHVSYTSAAVSAFSVIVVLTMAYVVGNHMANGPSHAVAGMTSEQLRLTPARPDVMNVHSEPAKNTTSEVKLIAQTETADTTTVKPPITKEDAAAASRFVGRNYVVMQIYKDQKTAEDIAKRLTDAGLPSSVTRGLEGYSNDSWYCVVGLTGFEKMSGNADFKKYLSAVMSVNDKWSSADTKFKRLEPQTYKWKS